MVGKFQLYAVGKNAQPSKSGKYGYTFLSGVRPERKRGLLEKCEAITWWSDKSYDFNILQLVEALVEIRGDYINILEIFELQKEPKEGEQSDKETSGNEG